MTFAEDSVSTIQRQFAFVLLSTFLPSLVHAQQPTLELSGRVQFQGYHFDNSSVAGTVGPESNFFARRVRIEAEGQITPAISYTLEPAFENGRGGEPNLRLLDAWIEYRVTRAGAPTELTLRAGQEKRPFGRYELTSSKNLPSIERGAGRGLLRLASNDLFTAAGALTRDVGVSATATFGDRFTAKAGVYNGEGESANDENNRKSFGVRTTFAVASELAVGASYFLHDGIVGADSSFTNDAFGIDAQWGAPGAPGLYLVADYMDGERFTAAREHIRGLSLVSAYHLRLPRGGALYAIEPAARFDLADPDVDTDDDQAYLVTATLGLYLSSHAHIRVAYEAQLFDAPGVESIHGLRSAVAVDF